MLFLLFILNYSPPPEIRAFDTPSDAGQSITINWSLSPDDTLLDGYAIYRALVEETTFIRVGLVGRGVSRFEDDRVKTGVEYYYRVGAIKDTSIALSTISNRVRAIPQFFHTGRINVLLALVVFSSLVIY
ncbi:MAG: fibronectin type III domain-containing protein, partial [candidate division WOR-3 bacterium]